MEYFFILIMLANLAGSMFAPHLEVQVAAMVAAGLFAVAIAILRHAKREA